MIQEWYKHRDPSVRADFDTTLNNLSIAPAPDWRNMKEFKHLGREGLCEIRFATANVQYRVLGFFGPGKNTFSLYVGATHKQRIYNPPDAFDLAIKHRNSVKNGKGSLRERPL
ncbi:MAG: type II toxin-antitoxin system RelE/ParE family toxin [Bryobacteraceae bacterium]